MWQAFLRGGIWPRPGWVPLLKSGQKQQGVMMSVIVRRSEWKAIAKVTTLSAEQRQSVHRSHRKQRARIELSEKMLFAMPSGIWSMRIFTKDDIDEVIEFIERCDCDDPELLERRYWEHVAECSCSPVYLPTLVVATPTSGKRKSGHKVKVTAKMTQRCFGECHGGGTCTTRTIDVMGQKVVVCECA